MANVVRDPREHPDAIIPDLSEARPAGEFTKDDIALSTAATGSSATSRRSATTTFRLPAQWDVTHKKWRPYFVEGRLVGRALPARQFPAPDRPALRRLPFGQLRHRDQDGHGMERRLRAMPRPGQRAREAAQTRANIVNPARLDYVQANDTCIQCHSQGRPLNNPIEGKYYDWPVGYRRRA